MILDVVVDAAAAYRLTRLVTADDLLNEPRGAFVRWAYRNVGRRGPEGLAVTEAMDRAGFDPDRLADWSDYAQHDRDAPKLATLVTCRWCTGMWVSLGVVVARRVAPRLWDRFARAFAFSAAAALLASLED